MHTETRLFAYGTLLPGEPRWQFLAPYVVDEGTPAVVRGTLYDTGEGYPAAMFNTDSTEHEIVKGRVFVLRGESLDEAIAVLDDVEGAVEGGYARVRVTTIDGDEAWAYQYGGGLALEPIVGGSWINRFDAP